MDGSLIFGDTGSVVIGSPVQGTLRGLSEHGQAFWWLQLARQRFGMHLYNIVSHLTGIPAQHFWIVTDQLGHLQNSSANIPIEHGFIISLRLRGRGGVSGEDSLPMDLSSSAHTSFSAYGPISPKKVSLNLLAAPTPARGKLSSGSNDKEVRPQRGGLPTGTAAPSKPGPSSASVARHPVDAWQVYLDSKGSPTTVTSPVPSTAPQLLGDCRGVPDEEWQQQSGRRSQKFEQRPQVSWDSLKLIDSFKAVDNTIVELIPASQIDDHSRGVSLIKLSDLPTVLGLNPQGPLAVLVGGSSEMHKQKLRDVDLPPGVPRQITVMDPFSQKRFLKMATLYQLGTSSIQLLTHQAEGTLPTATSVEVRAYLKAEHAAQHICEELRRSPKTTWSGILQQTFRTTALETYTFHIQGDPKQHVPETFAATLRIPSAEAESLLSRSGLGGVVFNELLREGVKSRFCLIWLPGVTVPAAALAQVKDIAGFKGLHSSRTGLAARFTHGEIASARKQLLRNDSRFLEMKTWMLFPSLSGPLLGYRHLLMQRR